MRWTLDLLKSGNAVYGPNGFPRFFESRRGKIRVTPGWNILNMTEEILLLIRMGFVLRFDRSDRGSATVGDYDWVQLEAIPALMKHYAKPWFKTKSAKFQECLTDMLFGPPS